MEMSDIVFWTLASVLLLATLGAAVCSVMACFSSRLAGNDRQTGGVP
jgi:hypothetical protein